MTFTDGFGRTASVPVFDQTPKAGDTILRKLDDGSYAAWAHGMQANMVGYKIEGRGQTPEGALTNFSARLMREVAENWWRWFMGRDKS